MSWSSLQIDCTGVMHECIEHHAGVKIHAGKVWDLKGKEYSEKKSMGIQKQYLSTLVYNSMLQWILKAKGSTCQDIMQSSKHKKYCCAWLFNIYYVPRQFRVCV